MLIKISSSRSWKAANQKIWKNWELTRAISKIVPLGLDGYKEVKRTAKMVN